MKSLSASLATLALIITAGLAHASDSGIVKGKEIKFGSIAKHDRACQIVERVDPDTGKVTRKMECVKGKSK